MQANALTAAEFARFLAARPAPTRPLVRALRRLVRRCVGPAREAIRYGALCYFRAAAPYGAIGGNICMIEADTRGVRLSFLHGTDLPDPRGLLRGTAKAKRFLEIHSADDLRRPDLQAFIETAAALALDR